MRSILIALIICLSPMTAWSAFPTTSILDNFNRANEGPPMTGWSDIVPGLKVVSNQCKGNDVATNLSGWGGGPYGPDGIEAYVTIATKGVDGTDIVSLQMLDGSLNGYVLQVNFLSGTDTIQVFRSDALTPTQLGADISQEISASDQIGFIVQGGVITVYRNGVSIATRSDSTYTALQPSLYVNVSGTTTIIDGFGGGNYVAPTRRRSGQLIGG